eukprot:jgi/Botrbrau1/1076/Bobra.0076s0041.1
MEVLVKKIKPLAAIDSDHSSHRRLELVAGLDYALRRRQHVGLSHTFCSTGQGKSCSKALGFQVRASKDDVSKVALTAQEAEDGVGAFLRATEVLCLAAAGAFQIWYLWQVYRQTSNGEKVRRGKEQRTMRAEVLTEAVVSPTPLPTSATVLAIVMALVANVMFRWRSARRAAGMNRQLAASGAARLARLEAVANKQGQLLADAEKQLEKLHIRVRLKNQDILPQVLKLQGTAEQQSDVLVKVTRRLEDLEGDVRDTQVLLGQLQDVVQKQVSLVLQAIHIARGLQAGQSVVDALEVIEDESSGYPDVSGASGGQGAQVGKGFSPSTSQSPVATAATAGESGPRIVGTSASGPIAGRLYSAVVLNPDSRLAGAAALVATRSAARRGAFAVSPAAMGPTVSNDKALPSAVYPLTLQQSNGLSELIHRRAACRRTTMGVVSPVPMSASRGTLTRTAGGESPPADLHHGLAALLVAKGKVKRHIGEKSPEILESADRMEARVAAIADILVQRERLQGIASAKSGGEGLRLEHASSSASIISSRQVQRQVGDGIDPVLGDTLRSVFDDFQSQLLAQNPTALSDIVKGLTAAGRHLKADPAAGEALAALRDIAAAHLTIQTSADRSVVDVPGRVVEDVVSAPAPSGKSVGQAQQTRNAARVLSALSFLKERIADGQPEVIVAVQQVLKQAKAAILETDPQLASKLSSGIERIQERLQKLDPETATAVSDFIGTLHRGVSERTSPSSSAVILRQAVTEIKSHVLKANPVTAEALKRGLDGLRDRISMGNPDVLAAAASQLALLRSRVAAGDMGAVLASLKTLQTAGIGQLPNQNHEATDLVASRLAARHGLSPDETVLVSSALRGAISAVPDTVLAAADIPTMARAAASSLKGLSPLLAARLSSRSASPTNGASPEASPMPAFAGDHSPSEPPVETLPSIPDQDCPVPLDSASHFLATRLAHLRTPSLGGPVAASPLTIAGAAGGTPSRSWGHLRSVVKLGQQSVPSHLEGLAAVLDQRASARRPSSGDSRRLASPAEALAPSTASGGVTSIGPPPGSLMAGAGRGYSVSDLILTRVAVRRHPSALGPRGEPVGAPTPFDDYLDTQFASPGGGPAMPRTIGPKYPSTVERAASPGDTSVPPASYYDTRFAAPRRSGTPVTTSEDVAGADSPNGLGAGDGDSPARSGAPGAGQAKSLIMQRFASGAAYTVSWVASAFPVQASATAGAPPRGAPRGNGSLSAGPKSQPIRGADAAALDGAVNSDQAKRLLMERSAIGAAYTVSWNVSTRGSTAATAGAPSASPRGVVKSTGPGAVLQAGKPSPLEAPVQDTTRPDELSVPLLPALVGPDRAKCLQTSRSVRGSSYIASWGSISGPVPPKATPSEPLVALYPMSQMAGLPALVGPDRAKSLQTMRSTVGASYIASWAVHSGPVPPRATPYAQLSTSVQLPSTPSLPRTGLAPAAVPMQATGFAAGPLTSLDPHPSKVLVNRRVGRGEAYLASWSALDDRAPAAGQARPAGVADVPSEEVSAPAISTSPGEASAQAVAQMGAGKDVPVTVIPLDDGTLLFRF